jgi:hypothetical protein
MITTEERLAQIRARLEQTSEDFRNLTLDFERLQSENILLRGAIMRHAQITNSGREQLSKTDRELYMALQNAPRNDLMRKTMLVVEAARKFVVSGRDGEELNRRALYAVVQDYDETVGASV